MLDAWPVMLASLIDATDSASSLQASPHGAPSASPALMLRDEGGQIRRSQARLEDDAEAPVN